MISIVQRGTRPGTRHLGARPVPARPGTATPPAPKRRGSLLLAAPLGTGTAV